MIYRVYNHNNTLLGEFKTEKEAQKEASYYREVTGNPAYYQGETV
jgi:hypothetical protein